MNVKAQCQVPSRLCTRMVAREGNHVLSVNPYGNATDMDHGGVSMLILTRRTGETILIGDDVAVTILGVNGNQVRIGVKAPNDVFVDREEVRRRKVATGAEDVEKTA